MMDCRNPKLQESLATALLGTHAATWYAQFTDACTSLEDLSWRHGSAVDLICSFIGFP